MRVSSTLMSWSNENKSRTDITSGSGETLVDSNKDEMMRVGGGGRERALCCHQIISHQPQINSHPRSNKVSSHEAKQIWY